MSLAQGCGARQRARAVRGVTEGRWFDLKAGKGGSRGKNLGRSLDSTPSMALLFMDSRTVARPG